MQGLASMKGFAPGRVVGIAAVLAAATFGAIVLSKSPLATSPAKISPSSFAELVALPEQEVVRTAEQKYSPQYLKNPARYDNSYAKFKAVNLGLTLQQDLQCGYNMDLVTSGAMADIRSTRFYRDSKDVFLHGFTERRKGSCSSFPVLTVAVGRRCGYPLFLVTSKGHLFCRWDDGKEQFNIETAGEGVDSKPDSHYREWPHAFDQEEERTEKFLKNLNPAEALGVMAQTRAMCLQENQKPGEAALAYEVALRSFPESKMLTAYLSRVKGGQ
jgi:hypothetical protein